QWEVFIVTGYLIRRILYSMFVVWGAVTVIFFIIRIVPGDPAAVMLGTSATPEQVNELREALGLNESLLIQYGNYLLDVVQLDFGESFKLGGEALNHVLYRLPFTITLAVSAILIALLISFPLGILAARKANKFTDWLISTVSLVVQSLPTFWVGIMLILIFARFLNILPSAGSGSYAHLILPAFTLCLPIIGMIVRLIQNGILDELSQGYVQTARSKGLKENIVFYVHVLRNVLIPVVTIMGDRKSTRLNSSHVSISYAVFCLKKKN